ncbi:7214_t:CDS:2, partial [Ambispora gerdemannii]
MILVTIARFGCNECSDHKLSHMRQNPPPQQQKERQNYCIASTATTYQRNQNSPQNKKTKHQWQKIEEKTYNCKATASN